MAERLLWDSLRALARARLIQVGKNLATIAILHPLVIPRVIKNRLFSEQRAELFSMIRSAMSGGTPRFAFPQLITTYFCPQTFGICLGLTLSLL